MFLRLPLVLATQIERFTLVDQSFTNHFTHVTVCFCENTDPALMRVK